MLQIENQIWSVKILFISSGIDLSLDLKPASMCAILILFLDAINEQAKVELTSPTTTTRFGLFIFIKLSYHHYFSNLMSMCFFFNFKIHIGFFILSCLKKHLTYLNYNVVLYELI